MNTRPLNQHESKNLVALNEAGHSSVLLFLTETGLRKAILDATEPMRKMLRDSGVHNFGNQSQGQENKVLKTAFIFTDDNIEKIGVSLYRPTTKKGDPRLWFSEFRAHASPGEVCAVFAYNQIIHVLNLSRSKLADQLAMQIQNPMTVLLRTISSASSAVSMELLGLLKALAISGPIKAVCKGNTAVGRSIESALGIKINSNKAPDYKGIEIKSGRSTIVSRQTRATLFGCVPDWNISRYKSSTEILNRFGYARNGRFLLNCTVKVVTANSQGLQLGVLDKESLLREYYALSPQEEVCMWNLSHLHKCLAEKHNETFWVKAKASHHGGYEWFQLESIIHTSKPSMPQFDRMLTDSTITLDHLSKRKPSGTAHERGPLFKIDRPRIGELFLGEPRKYLLAS